MPQNYNLPQNQTGGVYHQKGGNTSSLPLKDNQHFMVWMRPSAQPTVRKLYGVIHQDLAPGELLNWGFGSCTAYEAVQTDQGSCMT